jgi:uncharacterized protein (DUF427 family)
LLDNGTLIFKHTPATEGTRKVGKSPFAFFLLINLLKLKFQTNKICKFPKLISGILCLFYRHSPLCSLFFIFAILHQKAYFSFMKAIWNGTILAESDDTIIVEGNHYFPENAINKEYFQPSEKHTVCGWKGIAGYYDIVVNGETNKDAAWYYPETKDEAKEIENRVAFWKGVEVRE